MLLKVAEWQPFWISVICTLHITYFHRHSLGGASVAGLGGGMRSSLLSNSHFIDQ